LAGEPADNKVNCWEASGAGCVVASTVITAGMSKFRPRPEDPVSVRAKLPVIDPLNRSMPTGAVDLLNVGVPGDVGPVPLEDGVAGGIDLNLPCRLPTGALNPEVKATDAGEQGAEASCPAHVMPPPANVKA
jgi:hypothetical protein